MRTFFTLLALALLAQCTPKANPGTGSAADNTLTAKEQKDGWKLLFDGKTFNGWHKYGATTIGNAWMVEDNAMHLKVEAKASPARAKDGGDIVTDGEYQDYELALDWKISACGNSGVYYNVVEYAAKYQNGWMTGPEMQVLDDACHPDAKIIKHRAGDLYDMISCNPVTVKPAGEWNHARLISKQGKVEHWLNGQKVVSYDMNTSAWPALIAASKFKVYPDFGKARKGRIALQDHGDLVWYKNIKIRLL
jgi:cytochrome c